MTKRLKKVNKTVISEQFINSVCKRIAENKPIRRTLPQNGRLHIDRPLPFICVYRRPARENDPGTEKLVKGEASYLITSSGAKLMASVSSLLQNTISPIAKEHKAFLIIELWSKKQNPNDESSQLGIQNPQINLIISKEKFHTATVETLQKALGIINIQRQNINVDIIYKKKQWPENMKPLVSATFAKQMNCYTIGVEIEPFYQNVENSESFPLLLRQLHQGLSRAFKLGVFQFTREQTKLKPTTYLALGRRAMVKAVWEVDRKLAEISSSYDFLLLVTPINIDQSWNKFKADKFERPPIFYYRPIPISPSNLKLKLFSIPIDNMEDPTLTSLFLEKQIEMEKTLTMLRDRGTKNFFYGSMQLYGEIDDKLISLAKNILEQGTTRGYEDSKIKYYNAAAFAKRAEEEIEYYKNQYPGVFSKIQIREDITGLMVSRGNLLLGSKINISEKRVDALLQHEIGTHVLTYINGMAQPFKQLHVGLAGYDELQEGIAVLSEYLVGGLNNSRIRLLAGRVMASSYLIEGATFIDTFRELHNKFAFTQRIAYIITSRIYRGGGLTKDAVYLRGFVKILDHFVNGGSLEPLLVGKISSEHIPIIRELQARKILKPIPLRPRYLENPEAIKKLNELKNGISILDLIKRR